MNELILSHALMGALFGADQLLKKKAEGMERGRIRKLPLGVRFTRSFNRGAAMNLGQETPELVAASSLLVLGAAEAALLIRLLGGKKDLCTAGLTLMVGGAASNVYDRFVKGGVTDYIRFATGFKKLDETVFNLGDFAIFAGALMTGAGSGEI